MSANEQTFITYMSERNYRSITYRFVALIKIETLVLVHKLDIYTHKLVHVQRKMVNMCLKTVEQHDSLPD